MAYFNDKFKMARLDQSPYLFHFINGYDQSPHETLRKILEENVKVKSTGKPMYQPWGLGFSRDILVRDFGARNVIYTDGTEEIPDHLEWRTQKLDVDSYDFEYLREWRIKNGKFDFSGFPRGDMIVIAPDYNCLNDLVVRFDMEFTPFVNHYTGDIEEDWSEVWKREWKGLSVDKLDSNNILDDFAVSGSTISQILEEDMLDKLLSDSPWSVLTNK